MLVEHPAYCGNVVATFKEIGATETGFVETGRPADIRWWVKDWSEEELAKLDPEIPGFWQTHKEGVDFEVGGGHVAFQKVMDEFGKQVPEDVAGQTFASVLEEAGGDACVQNLETSEKNISHRASIPQGL